MRLAVDGREAYAYTGGRPFDPALPAVVLVPGVALDHSVWQWQSRHLAHHGFAVLAPDLPGHGRSPGPSKPTVAEMADWVAALAAAAGLKRASVVGHSLGSLAALETAIRHPGLVERLALLGTAAPMPVGDAFLAAAKDDSPAAFEMQTTWGHARNVALAASPAPGIVLAGSGRRLVGRAAPGVQHSDLSACHAWAPSAEAIRSLAIPTLVVAGRRDQMTPLKAGRALASEIPGARFVALDTGHALMGEAPREVARLLRDFLAAPAAR